MSDNYTLIESVEAMAPAILPNSTVSRTLVNQPGLHVILFAFAAGEELSEHTSARTAVLHFIKGEARLVLGGDPARAVAGTMVQMAPRLPHSVYAETDTLMLLTMVGD